ncbi:DUF7638 domain-containing protein [Embleya sp. AB8]|uniref:DUF7638 domain-containing protein n=1 Tax=Embleya sp. AB8 TaxID=3156304 RepID=UPI003C746E2A
MTIDPPTWRHVDGERVPGTWRHVFIRNGDYHLTDLFVYADAMVDCWGLVSLAEFAEQVESGWVATELEAGARGSLDSTASWRFDEPESWISAEELLGEVHDIVDRLNGRPDSTARCLAVLDEFLAEPGEERRVALSRAHHTIPEGQRRYALKDQDRKDYPLRVLVTGIGGELWPDHVVTAEAYTEALAYCTERRAAPGPPAPWDGPEGAWTPTVDVPARFFRDGWPAEPGVLVLRNEYPVAIEVGALSCPSVAHAYWATATADPAARARIAATADPFEAKRIAAEAPVRAGWSAARTAVMARLLRAKFAADPALAHVLAETGDARIGYRDIDSDFWGESGETGRNWVGRLLELIRAEHAAARLEP